MKSARCKVSTGAISYKNNSKSDLTCPVVAMLLHLDASIFELNTQTACSRIVEERLLQRHRRRRLDPVQHKTGFAVLHAGVLEQGVHDEAAVMRHVLHHHPQQ